MMVGACGISCEVCGLRIKGVCKGCVPGNDPNVNERLSYLRSINALCPVLRCAAEKKVAYCLRDCDSFPCEVFEKGGFPYSEAFLKTFRSLLEKAHGRM